MKDLFSLYLCGLCGLVGLLIPASVSAQYSTVDDGEPRFEWLGEVKTDFRNEFDTKTDGGDKFESWQLGASANYGGPIDDSILIGMQAGYRFAHYDWNLDNGPGPASFGSNELPYDPFGSINTVDLMPNMTVLFGDRISVAAAVPIRYSGETGANRNGFTAGISAIVRWQITDEIRVGGGVGLTSQLEGSAETFPIVTLDWQITDSLELRTEGGWIQGGNVALLWGPNRAVRLTLATGYERNQFRLDDNGFQADRNGIGEITAVPIEIGIRFELYEGAFLDVRTGLGVAGRIRIENDNGQKLYDQNYDPSPRVGVGLTIPF